MRSRAALVLVFLLASGCLGHDGHLRSAGKGPRLLAGVLNEGSGPAEAELRLVAPNATLAWSANLTVAPIETMERITDLAPGEAYVLELRLAGSEAPLASARVDTKECRGTMHLVFALAADGSATEATRECHE